MHKILFQYINQRTGASLTDNERAIIESAFTHRRIRKKQYFLQKGEVCKYFAFIVKGALRQYSIDERGTEHIVRLSIENWWCGDRESYVMLTPTIYNIDAWEDTDTLIITRASMLELMNQVPVMVQLARSLDENHSIALQKRLNASISFPADARYVDFANTYPEFLQRFPQHMIASYLGITKETLSRLRKQITKK